MNNNNIVDNIKCLSLCDKNILKKDGYKNVRQLSIFDISGTYDTIDEYNYFITNEDIYYTNLFNGIYFNKNKKILLYSRYYLQYYDSLIQNIDIIYNIINNINIDNAIDIGNSYIAVQNWFPTYGHFMDEAKRIFPKEGIEHPKNDFYPIPMDGTYGWLGDFYF